MIADLLYLMAAYIVIGETLGIWIVCIPLASKIPGDGEYKKVAKKFLIDFGYMTFLWPFWIARKVKNTLQ